MARPEVKVALDISDSTLRELFLQTLSGYRVSPSQPWEDATVVVQDRSVDSPSSTPVVQLWQVGRARKNTGANPFAATGARNFIAAQPTLRSEDLNTTFEHLFEHRFIGLQQLMPNPKDVVTLLEHASTTRHQHLEQLHAFFEKHKTNKHLIESMEFAFEEMFSNAVYNAPVDNTGTHLNASKSRSETVTSERGFIIEYRIDENYFGLSVRDAYGTLGADRILECLRRCYEQGGAQFEEKAGGAGLGFFMVLQQATRLVVNVKAGQFSEVIVLRRVGESRREFMMTTPTLNLCFVSGEAAATASRSYARMPVRWPARVLVGDVERTATIHDISPRGAFLVFDGGLDEFVRGTVLTIASAPSADRPPIATQARVCWVGVSNTHRSPGVGVEFLTALADDVYGWLAE